MEIQGKYNKVKIFTDCIDNKSIRQIYNTLNNPGFADSHIAIMPDVHMGKGSVVGFTMRVNQYICPAVVGVDIGCGVSAYNMGRQDINPKIFDSFVRENIPSGRRVHSSPVNSYFTPSASLIKLIEKIAPEEYGRIMQSAGTLGGGNHFLELDKDDDENIWLLIHSGSRNLGLKVCHYHQKKAKEYIKDVFKGAGAYHGMEYMPLDCGGEAYLRDMKVAQEYAEQNRTVMAQIISEGFFKITLSECESISSIHNYYNSDDKIIRKGAIAAPAGKKVIIPLNMRDGAIIATGKGNPDWNFSAPHGAGRLLSRSESKELITLEEFRESMKDIYCSSISKSTIDESPMAYKSSEEIKRFIQDTVNIDFIVKPVYNFKSGNI